MVPRGWALIDLLIPLLFYVVPESGFLSSGETSEWINWQFGSDIHGTQMMNPKDLQSCSATLRLSVLTC